MEILPKLGGKNMIIGFTGFHSSGKSDLCKYLELKYGWRWVIKRDLLKDWSGMGDDESAWIRWYRNLYRTSGGYKVMHHLIKRMGYSRGSNAVILMDSVHTPDEWRAITEVDPNSLLVCVYIPKELRLERSTPEDLSLDIRRERHWHSEAGDECLLSHVEWAFCGIASHELRSLEAEALFGHLVRVGKLDPSLL